MPFLFFFPTGDKSLPPKLEHSDSIPPLIHSDTDPEPPTLKPIDAAPDCEDKTHSKRVKFDGEIPDLLSSTPRLNGYSRDSLQSSLLDGDVSVVATSTLAEPTGTVNRRTAVLFRKSKAASPHKPPRSGDEGADGVDRKEDGEEEDEDGAQLGSKSFLSVVIPRLETLLHSKKRKHSGSRDSEEEGGEGEHEEEGESPVKRLDTGKKCAEKNTLKKQQLMFFNVWSLVPSIFSPSYSNLHIFPAFSQSSAWLNISLSYHMLEFE